MFPCRCWIRGIRGLPNDFIGLKYLVIKSCLYMKWTLDTRTGSFHGNIRWCYMFFLANKRFFMGPLLKIVVSWPIFLGSSLGYWVSLNPKTLTCILRKDSWAISISSFTCIWVKVDKKLYELWLSLKSTNEYLGKYFLSPIDKMYRVRL